MNGFLDTLGALVLLAGTVFLALGALGLIRMPDSFNRIQAGTKATTLGTLLVLLGAGLIAPAFASKLVLIGLFLLFTNPLSSQVLARAAARIHAPKVLGDAVDRYGEDHPDAKGGRA
ncbi:monovalent cation/H(+) antiporter subunit G [Phaeovulum sp.]|uniref:monovalent cation/H(+) antiporter subunit G n=1 Tax=Phaeovulum sp. TaxID=2934796 RepID=UPI0035671A17